MAGHEGTPANVELGGGLIKRRAYERRTFALFQYDDLRLDLGRKTAAGAHDTCSTTWPRTSDPDRRRR